MADLNIAELRRLLESLEAKRSEHVVDAIQLCIHAWDDDISPLIDALPALLDRAEAAEKVEDEVAKIRDFCLGKRDSYIHAGSIANSLAALLRGKEA